MTDCNTKPISFSSLKRRQVLADFNGGSLTSDAGALLLREADRQLGLTAALDKVIPDPRNPFYIVHQQRTLLRQRVYGLAMGYEDVSDQQALRVDPLMQLVTDRGVREELPLASPPTICRLENRIHRRTLADLAGVLVETFIGSFKEPPQELVLDFDATNDPIHGDQVGRFFHGYYDEYCFLPLYVFCGSQLLVAYLRPSDIDGAKHAWAILALLVKRFRQAWPDVKIIFRGDSGFCRWRMLRWCDRHSVDYLVGTAKNSCLLKLAAPLMEQAKKQCDAGGQKQRLFGWIEYAAGTWDKKRRLVAKAEHDEKGANPRFVVTTLQGDAQQIYDEIYCARGEAENRIKEQQLSGHVNWTGSHIRQILSCPIYIGVVIFNRPCAVLDSETGEIKIENNHLSKWVIKVIPELRAWDDDLWKKVRRRAAHVRDHAPATGKNYRARELYPVALLLGVLICGCCGRELNLIRSTGSHKQYGCPNGCNHVGNCTQHSSKSARLVESSVLDYIAQRVLTSERIKEMVVAANRYLANEAKKRPMY